MKNKNLNHPEIEAFTTTKSLLLDLDKTLKSQVKDIAEYMVKRFKLDGYIILRSSPLSHHVVFNNYLTWRKSQEILYKLVWKLHYHEHNPLPSLTNWAILQTIKGSYTLRISNKAKKKPPNIIYTWGKTDKLIQDYLNYRDEIHGNNT